MSRKKGFARPTTQGLVVDSSISVAWCFGDEQDAYSQPVPDALADRPACVPYLWHLEVANTLIKRSTQADTFTWLGFLAALPITVDETTKDYAFTDTLHLARSHNLSVYDAAYLELAIRRGLPLATLDERLRTAARSIGATLFNLP